jgi:hypothetical protein
MLSAQDVPLYLVAVKSFLRFYNTVAVVVHSDGTLDGASAALIRRHVPGCRVIPAAEADDHARRSLGEGSFLFRWRGVDASYRRLIDTELWSSSPKRIIMDADILTLRPPRQVIEWVEGGESPFLLGGGPDADAPYDPASSGGHKHMQNIFRQKLGQVSEATGLPKKFLHGATAAFYGCGGELSLERIEHLLKQCLDRGIPMHEWGADQCIVVYLLTAAGASRLDRERYFNFAPEFVDRLATAELVHFFGLYRFYKNLYTDLASDIATSLTRTPLPVS